MYKSNSFSSAPDGVRPDQGAWSSVAGVGSRSARCRDAEGLEDSPDLQPGSAIWAARQSVLGHCEMSVLGLTQPA